tara:strand:+ start:30064 stop:30168 length:105 start_codon:yes stop_codon:yes gene_type:complete
MNINYSEPRNIPHLLSKKEKGFITEKKLLNKIYL